MDEWSRMPLIAPSRPSTHGGGGSSSARARLVEGGSMLGYLPRRPLPIGAGTVYLAGDSGARRFRASTSRQAPTAAISTNTSCADGCGTSLTGTATGGGVFDLRGDGASDGAPEQRPSDVPNVESVAERLVALAGVAERHLHKSKKAAPQKATCTF